MVCNKGSSGGGCAVWCVIREGVRCLEGEL